MDIKEIRNIVAIGEVAGVEESEINDEFLILGATQDQINEVLAKRFGIKKDEAPSMAKGNTDKQDARIKKVMFREAERWTHGIYDCFEVTEDDLRPISQAECLTFINSPGVIRYGHNEKGYIIYGI